MRNFQHKDLAAGGWQKLTLMEQLANIGSEVSRARRWQGKDKKIFQGAVDRALELFDLTLEDSRWRKRGGLREIARVRELFLYATLGEEKNYKTSLEDLDKYFTQFALIARPEK